VTGLGFLAVTAAAAALYLASAVFLALACGLFLAVILEPLVAFCARRGLSRRHGAPLAVALLLVVIAGAPWPRRGGTCPSTRKN
jgi:predicted PurR-regulated permease PerM